MVKRLEAKYGVFLCEGNHDLFEDAGAFRERTAAAGLRLLVNDTALVPIRGVMVQVLGLRWGSGDTDPRAMSNRGDPAIAGSMKELLLQKRPGAFSILLAHHPHAFDYAEGIPLTLSGHTHGGQMMLTKGIGFGPAMFRYWSGLYQEAERVLVVSNGVGNWFPLRCRRPRRSCISPCVRSESVAAEVLAKKLEHQRSQVFLLGLKVKGMGRAFDDLQVMFDAQLGERRVQVL